MAIRTITLSNRPPVKIDESNWPIIAEAKDFAHDGQVECQATRTWSWWLNVRQHSDGRAIVYAGYSYFTAWQGEQSLKYRHGDYLVQTDKRHINVCEAIVAVAARMADGQHDDDAAHWDRLAQECMADLPAEDIDAPAQDDKSC